MKYIHTRGFSLIELLVVIAIVGILSSVVIGSMNYARTRGIDTAIIENIKGARAQSQLYYDDNGESYAGICDNVPTLGGTETIERALIGAQTAWGTSTQPLNVDLNTGGAWDTVTCHEDGAAFAVEVPLKATASGAPVMYCLDSADTLKQETTNLAAGAVACD
jgi:prepilin-type N-terminal cleavage/methylation domain-containing protein